MPGPPPPPPAAPPPPLFTTPKGGGAGGPDDRSALLKSIRQGAKLKKTVTVDKSAPMIPGKVTTPANNGTIGRAAGANAVNTANASMTNGLGLGGLFAGGMPKLRATGIQLDGAVSNTTPTEFPQPNRSNKQRSPDIPSSTIKPKTPETPTPSSNANFSSIQNQLKKQLALDSRSRGPPPPAPVRTPSSDDTQVSKQSFTIRNGSSSSSSISVITMQQQQQQSSSTFNLSTLQANVSTLHRKASSNVNISTLDSSLNNNLPAKPVISHGKPNLAPKPPLNGKPATPPKKLMINGKPVSRAQSMKTPRSPSPQSPDNNNLAGAAKFGTVRNMSSVLNSSLTLSTGNLTTTQQHVRSRPALNARPSAPPPSVPSTPHPPPPPSKMSVVKPPNHAPPPPPNVPLPQPPSHAPPPPPPQRTQAPQVPSRAPPAIPQHNTINNNNNNNAAPPPPPRHSSIRGESNNSTLKRISLDLDAKFSDRFHPVSHFPKPPPFRRVFKLYSSKQVGSKQPAPQPPVVVHRNHRQQNKSWDASSC